MNTPTARLRLGTRGSLLAVAQSRQIASALETAHPGLRVELVPLATHGDCDRRTPLQQVRDPAFFSAEIDRALLSGQVDLAVHSRKDIDGPRPDGLVTAAIPPRANPRDVVLFGATAMERLRRGLPLRVGTSSARRERQVREFLPLALPRVGPPPAVDCHALRGPVDQRLKSLNDSPSVAVLDAVVLALAGLERLWQDPDGRATIEPHLARLRWMVLPLGECPAAPGQGALAVECRAVDRTTRALLGPLHDALTAAEVAREYAAADALTGQARDIFSATAVTLPELDTLLFTRGAAAAGGRLWWPTPARPAGARPWDGGSWHQACAHRILPLPGSALRRPAVYVAHWRALDGALPIPGTMRTWVSGVASWRRLAARGVWVEGCADGLGFDAIRPTLGTPVLGLPPLANWAVLTRDSARGSWQNSGVGGVLATYALEAPDPATVAQLRAAAGAATHFFWSSREQYLALRDALPPDAEHACGAGKTLAALRKLGARPHPFPNRDTWRSWVA